jgi:hypothetical protein
MANKNGYISRKNLKRRKRYIPFPLIIAVLIMLVSAYAGDVGAWLQTSHSVDNIINMPLVRAVVEESNDGDIYNGWSSEPVNWGNNVAKYARFSNTGQAAVVIRVSYAQSWSVVEGGEVKYLSNLYNGAVIAEPNWRNGFSGTEPWFDSGDGWSYYRYPLFPGESTENILDYVSFVTAVPPGYENAEYSLLFTVESSQYSTKAENENQLAVWATFGMTYTEDGGSGLLTWSSNAP